MAVSTLPDNGGSISLQRVITSSGWVDLGTPRLIHFVLAGGGGGGGGSGNSTDIAGGGGGGGAGAVAGKLFIGGRVYVQIGAGGTAGAAGSTGNDTRAGNGGNSYLGIPLVNSNNVDSAGMYWISGVGGIGGANGTTSAGSATAAAVLPSLNATGIPSITGYTSPNIVVIGCGPGRGGGGGYGSGNGSTSADASSYYPNVAGSNNSAYSITLQGWANNDMRWFGGTGGTSVQNTYNGISGLNWTEFAPGNIFNPGAGTFAAPWTLWTSGTSSNGGLANGGTGGSIANQPAGFNGSSGFFTGGGGGGAIPGWMSGSGGNGSFYRGGESSRQFANATNYGGAGGAGILGPGSNALAGVNGSTGGKGGDGGFGGGGGGGSQCNTTGVTGGVGGQGALALFW